MTDSLSINSRLPHTTLVTVTYADRIEYLRILLERAFTVEGVARAIIVSNASTSPIYELEKKWGNDKLRVLRLDSNTGSANGYAAGIQAALDDGADYIWLMDDDNAPKPNALYALHQRLAQIITEIGADKAAVLGFRPEHQADIAQGIDTTLAYPPRSSFLGFHYRQIWFKIWRRIRGNQFAPSKLKKSVRIPYAPYGGLLASHDVFQKIGLPKRDLVLYADDTEYTYRITLAGGRIELVTNAELEDLESSWNLKKKAPNFFIGLLADGSEYRAFYSTRNRAWFDKYIYCDSLLEYRANQVLFNLIITFFSLKSNSMSRLKILNYAIKNGQENILGISSRFPLS